MKKTKEQIQKELDELKSFLNDSFDYLPYPLKDEAREKLAGFKTKKI